jgi:membrane protein implicated in regulation of membrane protease activity
MKTKLVLTIAILIGVLALISAGYCFWLMNIPLSYRWVPVVVTGFLLAIFVFVISLITSLVALIRLRRSPHGSNVSQIRPTI